MILHSLNNITNVSCECEGYGYRNKTAKKSKS